MINKLLNNMLDTSSKYYKIKIRTLFLGTFATGFFGGNVLADTGKGIPTAILTIVILLMMMFHLVTSTRALEVLTKNESEYQRTIGEILEALEEVE